MSRNAKVRKINSIFDILTLLLLYILIIFCQKKKSNLYYTVGSVAALCDVYKKLVSPIDYSASLA